jgi:hypothetical protein
MKLKFKPGVFNQELLAHIKQGQVGWPGDTHMEFVAALAGHLVDDKGDPVKLEGTRIEQTFRLIIRPTEDLQRMALRQAFKDAGYELDAQADGAFLLLLNVAQFADYLSKTDNPATGKPFIVKEKKKGVKKDTLAALLKVAPPNTTTSEPEPQPVEQKPEAAKAATPRKAAKPTDQEPEG